MITRRRKADDEDDLSLFLGSLPQTAPTTEELDELGRVVPQANPGATRRERLSARTATGAPGDTKAPKDETPSCRRPPYSKPQNKPQSMNARTKASNKK